MENLSVSSENRKVSGIPHLVHHTNENVRYIFAFPGMGKTPICQKRSGCIDLDFGLYRAAMDVAKEKESELFKGFARYAENLQQFGGFYIFMNEPGLLPFFPRERTVMFLPASRYSAQWCARKLNVDLDTCWEWIQGWKQKAIERGIYLCETDIPIVRYLLAPLNNQIRCESHCEIRWTKPN